MTRICVIALVGLPAAGKSTICQQLIHCSQLPFNVVHLRFDDFLQCDYSLQQTENFNFKMERSRIMTLLQSIVDNLKHSLKGFSFLLDHKIPAANHNSSDYVILCDDNNYYTSMRYKIYQLCKMNQLYYSQIFFPTDLSQSLQRNSERCRAEKVPDDIVEQMSKRLEVPNEQKNVWESTTLNLYSTSCNNHTTPIEAVVNFVSEIFQSHPNTLKSATLVDVEVEEKTTSPLHDLDITLRRHIKEILQQSSLNSELKQIRAKELNLKRKELLQNKSKFTANEIESLIIANSDEIYKLLN